MGEGPAPLKFGAQVVRNWDNKAISFQESLSFTTLDQFAANSPVVATTLGQPRMGMRNTYNHLFVQDDVQVTRNLTINAGLRYQYDTTPTESHGRIANYNPATRDVDPVGTSLFDAPKLNFAPRIGFAYSPDPLEADRDSMGVRHLPLGPRGRGCAIHAVQRARYRTIGVGGFARNWFPIPTRKTDSEHAHSVRLSERLGRPRTPNTGISTCSRQSRRVRWFRLVI